MAKTCTFKFQACFLFVFCSFRCSFVLFRVRVNILKHLDIWKKTFFLLHTWTALNCSHICHLSFFNARFIFHCWPGIYSQLFWFAQTFGPTFFVTKQNILLLSKNNQLHILVNKPFAFDDLLDMSMQTNFGPNIFKIIYL